MLLGYFFQIEIDLFICELLRKTFEIQILPLLARSVFIISIRTLFFLVPLPQSVLHVVALRGMSMVRSSPMGSALRVWTWSQQQCSDRPTDERATEKLNCTETTKDKHSLLKYSRRRHRQFIQLSGNGNYHLSLSMPASSHTVCLLYL